MLNWAALATLEPFFSCRPEKDNNNRCNYLRQSSDTKLGLTLRTNWCRANSDLWPVECFKNVLDSLKSIPRHFALDVTSCPRLKSFSFVISRLICERNEDGKKEPTANLISIELWVFILSQFDNIMLLCCVYSNMIFFPRAAQL